MRIIFLFNKYNGTYKIRNRGQFEQCLIFPTLQFVCSRFVFLSAIDFSLFDIPAHHLSKLLSSQYQYPAIYSVRNSQSNSLPLAHTPHIRKIRLIRMLHHIDRKNFRSHFIDGHLLAYRFYLNYTLLYINFHGVQEISTDQQTVLQHRIWNDMNRHRIRVSVYYDLGLKLSQCRLPVTPDSEKFDSRRLQPR